MKILRYLLGRLMYAIPVVWLVVSVVFLLIHLVPGDPILQMLGEGAPAADIAAARHAYGLDVPLWEQYLHYWKGVLHLYSGRCAIRTAPREMGRQAPKRGKPVRAFIS